MRIERDPKGSLLKRSFEVVAEKYLRTWLFKGVLIFAVGIAVGLYF